MALIFKIALITLLITLTIAFALAVVGAVKWWKEEHGQ